MKGLHVTQDQNLCFRTELDKVWLRFSPHARVKLFVEEPVIDKGLEENPSVGYGHIFMTKNVNWTCKNLLMLVDVGVSGKRLFDQSVG